LSYNNIQLIGRLGRNPETKAFDSGSSLTSFSIAVDFKSKDGKGTQWFTIKAWGKLAGLCQQFLTKGSQVFVSGELTVRHFKGRDGLEKTELEVNLKDITFLGGKEQQEKTGDSLQGVSDESKFTADDIPF
jgi:single-strand DNA-binding protein